MSDSTFTFRVDGDLKEAFARVADGQDRTAAQLLRHLMREVVQRQQNRGEHDVWFRDEVREALVEADDPALARAGHDEVRSSWRHQRADLERRATGRTA